MLTRSISVVYKCPPSALACSGILKYRPNASLELVDTMPEPELTREIVKISRSVAGVQGIDKVFARKTGLQYHIDLHIEVDPTETIAASHAIVLWGAQGPCVVVALRR